MYFDSVIAFLLAPELADLEAVKTAARLRSTLITSLKRGVNEKKPWRF
jgi:hypothetical protein